jgi:Fe-S-cluster containining protein
MSFADEEQKLSGLCAKCKGKCCKGHHIILSKSEFEKLRKKKDFPTKKIDSPTGCAVMTVDALSDSKCPFLTEGGCELKLEDRPLVCRLYPITFTVEKGEVIFHLSKLCPYFEEVRELKDWIKATLSDAEKELSEGWTKKEIKCYGSFLAKEKDGLAKLT